MFLFGNTAEDINTVLNTLTAFLIAAGGLGIGKWIRAATVRMADKTDEQTDRIVERLDAIEHVVQNTETKVNGLTTRVDRIEGKVTEDG